MTSKLQRLRNSAGDCLEQKVLPLGWFALLTGMFWLPQRNYYHKLYYLLLATPALLALICRPRQAAGLLRNPLVLCFLLFSGYMLLTLFWSDTHEYMISLAKRPLYILMLFLACGFLVQHSLQPLLRPMQWAAWTCNAAALLSLAYYLYGYLESAPHEFSRFSGYGALYNPLLSAHLYGFFTAWWLAAWFVDRQPIPLASLASLALLGILLLATGSRTPLVALGATMLWLTLLHGNRHALAVCMGCSVAAILLVMAYPESILQRGLSYRPDIWEQALQQIEQHPWLGHGLGHSVVIRIAAFKDAFADPHNIQLAVLLSGGLVGWLLWVVLYGLAVGYCLKHRQDTNVTRISALLIFGLVSGLTEGGAYLSRPKEHWFLVWIPMAMLAAAWQAKRQSRLSASTAVGTLPVASSHSMPISATAPAADGPESCPGGRT
jgi:O-antigen ligase